MKHLALALLIVATNLQAATIDCFSGGKKIYHGITDAYLVSEDVIIASYNGYDDIIFRKNKTSPNCVIKKFKSKKKV